MWRVVLFVGTVLAVALMGVSLWRGSILGSYQYCEVTPNSSTYYGCPALAQREGTYHPDSNQARYLRYAAGGVILITLASLPLLGLGRRSEAA